MTTLFLDCETTGLDPRNHVPWEVAIVEPDGTEPPTDDEAHTALGDALWVKRLYERITGTA